MLQNFLMAALRNFARNRFYTSINIIGLSIGLAVAILIALYLRNELSYERFLPGYERTYLLTERMVVGAEPTIWTPMSQAPVAQLLKTDFAALRDITRIVPDPGPISLRKGEVEAREKLYWADPNFFDVLPLPVVAGDLRTALNVPDGIVLTRRLARKYFHDDAPVGQTLEVNRTHSFQVTAVIEDLPANTHLATEIIASGRASFAPFADYAAHPERYVSSDALYTYLRLAPGVSINELQKAMPAFLKRRFPAWMFTRELSFSAEWVPIGDVHLSGINHTHKLMRPGGDASAIQSLSIVALLVLAVAGINFVNLMTARAGRRAVEVGVRKAAGATRRHLIVQFIGESVLQAAIAMIVAVALVEVLAPRVGAFLGQTLEFDYWRDPALGGALLVLTLLLGVLAGAYPAFVLSSFSPATVLKSGVAHTPGSRELREVLAVVQFAILIGLIISTAVIWRQLDFARAAGLRLNTDQMVAIATECQQAFKDEVAKLPGVRGVACASEDSMNLAQGHLPFTRRDGSLVWLVGTSVDVGYFELHGIRPIAGRVFARDRSADTITASFFEPAFATAAARVVMNETAVRMFGFASPREAVGQHIEGFGKHPLEVIGVVPDVGLDAIHKEIAPVVYGVFTPSFRYLLVKLTGSRLPETLDAIDATWRHVGEPRPIRRFFLDQHIQELYLDVIRRGRIFVAFATASVFIACLGLFALSAFTAERRTKEIGVRKALGAAQSDILRLLVWQFTKPVLWANLLAWPVAALALRHWLAGFAYHVSLEPWVFVLATGIALTIAIVTVSVHSLLVARTHPARALRYD